MPSLRGDDGMNDACGQRGKTGSRFPPFRRRGPSDRATPPDFRADLGEWARKSGCAVLRMTLEPLAAATKMRAGSARDCGRGESAIGGCRQGRRRYQFEAARDE